MAKTSILALSIGLITFCDAAPALAQSAGEESAFDIIVTARKRDESILTVPVIASVLTQSQIERVQVTSLDDIGAIATGLLIGQQPGELGTQVAIRGVGTNATDPGIDQSVSLNIDGMQLGQGLAYTVGLFDMAQIEVLKGPQALFFGKNSPGGVIAIRTADPGTELEVIGRLGYEVEARNWRGEAIVSGPVTGTLGLRLAAMYSDVDGFFKNTGTPLAGTGAVAPTPRFGGGKSLFVRGTAVFRPTDSFTARLKLNYTRDRLGYVAGYQLVSCPDGTGSPLGGLLQFFAPTEDCKQDRTLNYVGMSNGAFVGLRNDGVPYTNTTQKFGTLELGYDIAPDINLVSLTGYYNLRTNSLISGMSAGYAAPPIAAQKKLRRKDLTQEVRVSSSYSGPLNFTAGLFYQDGELTNEVELAGNTIYRLPQRLFQGFHDVDIKSISPFGQLRYKPIETLEVSAGVRWTHEKRSDTPRTVNVTGALGGPIGTVYFPVVPKLSSKNWAPELTLTYTPTTNLTIFGSLKQAYKSGSYNISAAVNPGSDNSFGDERARGGEIGMKARTFDGQVFVNLAAYRYNYSGLQVGVNFPIDGVPVSRTLNAGSSKVYGIDFDLSYNPRSVPGLSARGAINWNRARFTRFDNAPCFPGQTIGEGCNLLLNPLTGLFTAQDFKGTAPTRAPEWQANAGLDYETAIGSNIKLKLGASAQYSSDYQTILGNRKDYIQDQFIKLNANVAVSDEDESWEVSLIGNNLNNVLRAGSCANIHYAGGAVLPGLVTGGPARGIGGTSEVGCILEPGREVWLRLTIRPSRL